MKKIMIVLGFLGISGALKAVGTEVICPSGSCQCDQTCVQCPTAPLFGKKGTIILLEGATFACEEGTAPIKSNVSNPVTGASSEIWTCAPAASDELKK